MVKPGVGPRWPVAGLWPNFLPQGAVPQAGRAPSGQPSELRDALSFDLDLGPLPWQSSSLDGKNSGRPRLLPQLLHGAGPETWISPHGLAGLGCPTFRIAFDGPQHLLQGGSPESREPLAQHRCLSGGGMKGGQPSLCVGLSTKHLLTPAGGPGLGLTCSLLCTQGLAYRRCSVQKC